MAMSVLLKHNQIYP